MELLSDYCIDTTATEITIVMIATKNSLSLRGSFWFYNINQVLFRQHHSLTQNLLSIGYKAVQVHACAKGIAFYNDGIFALL
jgi:hypothetical protein